MSIPDDLIEMAMNLSAEDRIELARQIFASLPPVPEDRDPDWEESWAAEINRRQALIDSGQARLLSKEEFMKELYERMARRAGR